MIVLMAITLVYLFFAETLEHRRHMLAEFAKAQIVVTGYEAALKLLGDDAFSGPSRTGHSVTSDQVQSLYDGVQILQSKLATLAPPNSEIEMARDTYVRSLTTLLGRLNLFTESADGTIGVLEALVAIENPAKQYRIAASNYQNSVWISFRAAF